jgi:hypothetical protein
LKKLYPLKIKLLEFRILAIDEPGGNRNLKIIVNSAGVWVSHDSCNDDKMNYKDVKLCK